jgi:hypothetical protein
MTQEVDGFAESQAKKALKGRLHWETMKKRGHLSYFAFNILVWLGAYAVVRALHVLSFRQSWLSSPGSTSIENIICFAAIPGAIYAQLRWSDLKRKFDILPRGEDWTMK